MFDDITNHKITPVIGFPCHTHEKFPIVFQQFVFKRRDVVGGSLIWHHIVHLTTRLSDYTIMTVYK